MVWSLLFIFSIVLSLIVAGLSVLLGGKSSAVNRSFGKFSLVLAIWVLSNFIGANFKAYYIAELFVYSDFLIGPLMLYLFWVFTRELYFAATPHKSKKSFIPRTALIIAIICAGLSLNSGIVHIVHPDEGGIALEYGPLYGLYSGVMSVFAVWGLVYIIQARRHSNGLMRKQMNMMLIALSVAVSFVAASNLLLPQIIKSESVNLAAGNASYLGVAFFIALTAYTTLKHKMFNIRFIVARSVAYLLLVSTLISIYVAVIFGLTNQFIDNDQTISQQLVPMVAALFVAATASYFKKQFDRLTNKIFYRDAYDSETFLDELNKTIVSNIEIGILLRHTAMIIAENLKAECHIYVRDTETTPERIMGTSKKELRMKDVYLIKTELGTLQEKTVVADDLGEHYQDLKDALNKNDIAVISSLITNYAVDQEATAYLMLGPKKSGNSYSKQDLRIINIITDELLIAIQNALRFEEIQTFNITLQERINEATAKLKRSNEKLKEMDETKDEFISMASHQLRTPLTSVKGYLSMVLDGDAGKLNETQQQLLNQAFISSQRMVYLIADLLNVSRLKTGKFIIDRSATNLADMVESEMAQLTEVAKGRNLTLSFKKPENFPVLMLDETKTRQVVMNFVDNAIYYTPANGKIKLELRADRSSIYFIVKDNGLGVPKEEQAHLFTKFYRAKNAQKARPDGTGLGLFMAKKVITEQGGTILFESVEGKGSTFGFKFDRDPENEPDKS